MAATAEPNNKNKNKSRSDKKAQATQPSSVDKLKTIVRRLPPNLPEDVFWQSVLPWVTEETVSWRAFYPGKIRKKYNVNKENIPSRAYIAFRTMEQLATFSQVYDGHLFRDKAGNESYAVVEFAPYQKIPSEKRKVDTRLGTIEQDEDFKSFLAALSTAPSKPSETETIEALVAASQPPQQPKTTPLLDALRAEKQAQRDREAIIKAHAHYRDRDKEDLGARKKGKQPQAAERDETTPMPGPGKRNRRGGRKAETVTPAAAAKAKEKDAAPARSSKNVAKAIAKPASQQDPVVPAKAGAKEAQQERRPRPAIGIGLASRQFEAALTGAGVLPSGGSDRKSRRERERERKTSEAATVDESLSVATKEKEKVEKPQGPTSPGKERPRGGRKRGDSTKSQTAPVPTSAAESTPGQASTAVTSIGSQRVILTRPPPIGPKEFRAEPAQTGPKQGASGSGAPGEGRGGRRRGRGRGAARGGAPTAGT